MDEYPSVCYLDVQKTGSTFVSAFLQAHMSERRVRFQKHARIRDGFDPAKLYVITCRDPFAQYRSLYRFGLGGKGMLRRSLDAAGLAELYADRPGGFSDWLGFMLDPESGKVLGEGYGAGPNRLMGFQTFRFLALSFFKPLEVLKPLKTRDDVRRAYADRNIARRVLRTETLNADLRALVETDLRPLLRDPDAALKALDGAAVRNATASTPGADWADLGSRLRETLQDREWFMHDVLGYPRRA